MSSSLRKIKEKIEKNKNKKPRKAPVYNREDGPQCDVCLRRFSQNQKLRNHKARIHEGKTSKDFECPKCHKRFSQKSHLNVHNNTVHLKLREHVCEVCGRAFGLNAHLQRHIRMRHDKVRSAPCFQCGKTYASDSALMRHVRTVHDGVIANPRPCPKCDYVASYPSHLRIHFIGRHTTRRFQCAYGCTHGYTQVSSLGRHLKEKHRHKRKRYIMLALHKDDAKPALPENDTLPHQCELCDWRFPNMNFLAYHIKAKHC
jgi:KRAB domain-containing zinc finger protein